MNELVRILVNFLKLGLEVDGHARAGAKTILSTESCIVKRAAIGCHPYRNPWQEADHAQNGNII